MRVLGIETSCDETGVAIYDSEQGLIADQLYSQIELHAEYGGVVPELASRDHIRKISPLIKEALKQAKLDIKDIDGIAYTAGPGLVGALLVGASVAKSMAWALNKPIVGVHHMEAHLLAVMLEENKPSYPFLALIVSGGHTLLVQVDKFGSYEILGESLDDAVGEAFDKTAKLLGLGYPGGPAIAKLAEQGDPKAYKFPRPMLDRPGLDFSFSGLKTFVLNTWQKSDKTDRTKANIARAFEDAVVDTLQAKCKRALQQTHMTNLVIAGGVGANKKLRQNLTQLMHEFDGEVFYPRPKFCTDNGAMIAYAGYERLSRGLLNEQGMNIKARWPLTEL